MIAKHFDSTKFNVNIDNDTYIITEKNNKNCINFNVFDNENKKGIYVHMLDKCGEFSGKTLLNLLEDYAKDRGDIQLIDLEDASNLFVCDNVVSLYMLQLLSTGQSWYNKLGYKSHNYKNEMKNNKMQIEKIFIMVLYELINKTNIIDDPQLNGRLNELFKMTKKTNEKIFDNICTKLYEIILDISPDKTPNIFETMTVKQLFTILKQYLQKHNVDCHNNVSIISFVIMLFKKYCISDHTNEDGFYILYETMLSKPVHKTGGKTRRKRSV